MRSQWDGCVQQALQVVHLTCTRWAVRWTGRQKMCNLARKRAGPHWCGHCVAGQRGLLQQAKLPLVLADRLLSDKGETKRSCRAGCILIPLAQTLQHADARVRRLPQLLEPHK